MSRATTAEGRSGRRAQAAFSSSIRAPREGMGASEQEVRERTEREEIGVLIEKAAERLRRDVGRSSDQRLGHDRTAPSAPKSMSFE